jgi:uncharacterized damage-inducible protein DinB
MAISVQDLLRHQAWADAHFFGAWEASGAQEDEDLRQRADHILSVQEIFRKLIQGERPELNQGPPPIFADLKARCVASHEALEALAAGLGEAELARTLRVPFFPEPPCVIPVQDALLQACMHSQHHRGQCMTRLVALGASARNVDYLIWLWKGRPEPRWMAS